MLPLNSNMKQKQQTQNKLEKILSSVKSAGNSIKDAGRTALKETAKFCRDNYRVLALTTAWAVGGAGGAYILDKMVGEAKGDQLYITFKNKVPSVTRSDMSIIHEQGATEGYGYGDASFVEGPAPALDIWSEVNFDPYKLKVNSLPPESMTTIYDKISGRELPNPIDNELQFGIYDPKGENNFANKNIFADLYDSTHNLIGTYDIKNMVSTGTTIPLTISNGLSYTMDVRFEPNTFKFKDLANFADHWLQQCNIDNNKCDGLGEDGEYLNFIDFAYWANKWNPNN